MSVPTDKKVKKTYHPDGLLGQTFETLHGAPYGSRLGVLLNHFPSELRKVGARRLFINTGESLET